MRKLMAPSLLLLWSIFWASAAQAESAEEYLGQALEHIDSGSYDEAERALDRAEELEPGPLMRAEIHRQRGVIAQLRNRPAEAVREFLRMMEEDPSIQIRQPPYRPSVVELYQCARLLAARGMPPDEIETRLRRAELAGWVCPARDPELAAPDLRPRPPGPEPELTAEAPPAAERGFPVLPTIGIAAGAATLATGIGLGVDAESQAAGGVDKTGQADAANVLVGVGAGVAAVGAGWLIWQLVRR